MSNAIKKISVQRGYDVSDYTLSCFGGAGGQHACMVADKLGIKKIHLHPYAGVLSAYGIGLADSRTINDLAVELPLEASLIDQLNKDFKKLHANGRQELVSQNLNEKWDVVSKAIFVYQNHSQMELF